MVISHDMKMAQQCKINAVKNFPKNHQQFVGTPGKHTIQKPLKRRMKKGLSSRAPKQHQASPRCNKSLIDKPNGQQLINDQ